MHHLDAAWADILAWALVVAGLAALAGILVVIDRTRTTGARKSTTPKRLDRNREWALVTQRAASELERAPQLEKLQAEATVTIESAEYAYNRLLLDCAKHCSAAAAAAPASMPPPPEAPAEAPQQRPAAERAPLAA